jgi:CheY-like chemotaxis protein
LQTEKVNLIDAINAAVEATRLLFDERGRHLTINVPANLYVNGDLARLTQVFTNLLSNSALYTPDEGHIWLTAEEDDGQWAVITVKDTGKGVESVNLFHLFQMFYRVSDTAQHASDGTGVGLALAAKIIEIHGGHIAAKSDGANAGSEFTVRLPLWANGAEQPKAKEPAVDAQEKRAAVHKVLIADDSKDNAASLAILLEMNGYEIRTAHDGLEAVKIASQFLPDAVLLDIGMPEMDGYDAARQIRNEPWGKKMLVIAQSGWTQERDHHRSKEAGFDAHLGKPLNFERLIKLLGRQEEKQTKAETH